MKRVILINSSSPDMHNDVYKQTLINNDIKYFEIPWRFFTKNKQNFENEVGVVRILDPWYDKDLDLLKLDDINSQRYFNFILNNLYDSFNLDNVEFFNPVESIKILRNKKQMQNLLRKNGINIPKEYEYGELEKLIDSEKDGFFVKPNFGSNGYGLGRLVKKNGVYFFNDEKIDDLSSLENNDLVFQENITTPIINDKKFDLRISVLNYKPVFAYARLADKQEISTNISNGAESSLDVLRNIPKSKLEEALYLSSKTAEVLKMGFTGVDVIFDKNYNPYILEANSFPGLKGPMKYGFNPFALEAELLKNKYLK